jgi:Mrp family chromosome partitioning ATPase
MVVQPDISLIATASPPEHPSSLHPLLIVPPAAIVFALLGCVLAVVLVRLDRTLHTQADATEALHIPCVGLVPSIPPELSKQPHYLWGQPTSQFARAIRSILVSVLTSGSAASRTQRTVFVTSSVAGEGKTTLAWSLALYAARLGRRTLFLDFSQSVRRRADENASLLGLLTRERPLADVVEPIHDLGIDFLPAGISDGNRLRLLAHPKLSPLLRHVCDSYDLVVIDGPSLLEAPEARLLASWADHVLLAIHCGTTNRETAQTTLSQLVRTEPLNVPQNTAFWSVLTRVGPSQPDQLGRLLNTRFRRFLGAISHRSMAPITQRVTTDAAIEIRRHPASNLKSR